MIASIRFDDTSPATVPGPVRNLSVAALLLLNVMGCGDSSPTQDGLVRIRGTVNEAGRPLNQGSIVFHPKANAGIQGAGAVVKAGRFELPASQGLAPGKYAVEIQPGTSSTEAADGTITIDEITGAEVINQPTKISRSNPLVTKAKSTKRTPRSIEVTRDGPNHFDFDLNQQ